MNKQAFLNLLKNPESISSTDLEGLEEVIANFPFCQAAHILAAKGANDHGKMLSDKKIRKAAAYISERSGLKKLILKKTVSEPVKEHPLKEFFTLPVQEEKQPEIKVAEPVSKKPVEPVIIKGEAPIEKPTAIENPIIAEAKPKTVNEKFFAELEENLKSLRELKSKAAQDFTARDVAKENEKETPLVSKTPTLPDAKVIPEIRVEKPVFQAEKRELFPEPVKEHGEDITLFTSRLDEVVEEKNNKLKPAINEAELLLNYLSFLETHKNSAVKDKKKTEEIIENFIKKDPSIPYLNSINLPENQEDKASQSNKLKGGLISENMANIYALQGKKEKAIEIYQQLMLKNPEKKAYFASQIEKLKGN